jgi:hypothetical protein
VAGTETPQQLVEFFFSPEEEVIFIGLEGT